ncbi:MAG: hypothetical protein WCQ60_00770 [bacterium]
MKPILFILAWLSGGLVCYFALLVFNAWVDLIALQENVSATIPVSHLMVTLGKMQYHTANFATAHPHIVGLLWITFVLVSAAVVLFTWRKTLGRKSV